MPANQGRLHEHVVGSATQPKQEPHVSALLGDTAQRDYADKLSLFNAFAASELDLAISETMGLSPGAVVLDAGCGVGATLPMLSRRVAPDGLVIGVDLATAHVKRARLQGAPCVHVIQGSVANTPLARGSVDAIWCANTINHFKDPVAVIGGLARLLRPGGRIALAQSSLLPDMYFCWDERLEGAVNDAVRAYYRDRYGLQREEASGIRRLVGNMRSAGLADVRPRTFTLERVAPVDPATRTYLLDCIFRGTWGERLRKYLSAADFTTLENLCDPASEGFALDRADFHFLQTFTTVVGTLPS